MSDERLKYIPSNPDDPRSPEQRLSDTLEDLSGDLAEGFRSRADRRRRRIGMMGGRARITRAETDRIADHIEEDTRAMTERMRDELGLPPPTPKTNPPKPDI